MFFPNNKKGFSLIELLTYIGVLGIVGGLLTTVFYQVSVTQNREMASTEVSQQLHFVMDRIQGLVRESVAIGEIHEGATRGTACTSFCSLRLVMPQTNINPTIISSDVNGIYVKQGAADAVPITSDRVRISSLRFQRFDNPGGKATVSIDLSLTYNTTNPQLAITNTLISAVGRATAATFDSDLLPDATNIRNVGGVNLGWRRVLVGDGSASDPSYSFSAGTAMGLFRAGANILGFSTNSIERMRIDATGNVGIGTTTPGALLNVGSLTNSTRAFGDHPALFVSKPTEHTVPTAEIRFSPGNPLCVGCQNIALKVTTDDNQGSNKQNIGLWVDANRAANNYAAIFNTGNVGIGTMTPNTALDVSGAISVRGMAAPPVSPTGQGRIYFDSSLNRFRVSQHGAAYVDLVGGGGGTPGGTSGAVQFNAAGVFGGDATNFFWDNANMRLGIGTISPAARLHVLSASGDENSANVIIGSLGDANLRIGWLAGSRSWIQSHMGLPLHINRLGNNVILNAMAGNVGIGTTTPGSRLSVSGSTVIGSGFAGSVGPADGLAIQGSVGIGTTAPGARLDVFDGDIIVGRPQAIHGTVHRQFILHGAWNNLYIAPRNDANTGWLWDSFIITSGGNVGIGTAAPGSRLSVRGNTVIGSGFAGSMGPADGLAIQGNVGIGTTAPGQRLHVMGNIWASGSHFIIDRPDTTGGWARGIMYYPTNSSSGTELAGIGLLGTGTSVDRMYLAHGGNPWASTAGIHILTNGNVGIGTTNPGTNRLEVVGGPIRATGGLIIETRTSDPASPVAGQIWLRTDL